MANIMRLGGGGKKAEGEIPITANGIYDVAEYATANVNVQSAPELLWTNASPTSQFAAQTVSLNLANYASVIIEVKFSTGTAKYSKTLMNVGEQNNVCVTSNQKTHLDTDAYRNANVSNTGIVFSTAVSGSTSALYAIPTRIWGVKFTL